MMYPNIDEDRMPGDRQPMLKILHPPADGIMELWVLADREFGKFVHWDDRLRRNVPCVDPYGCICQERKVGVSWRAYLGVYDPRRKKNGIADLTADCWRDAGLLGWAEARGSLRGLKLVLSRFPHTSQGKQICKVYEPSIPQDDALPVRFCVKTELSRIWFVRL